MIRFAAVIGLVCMAASAMAQSAGRLTPVDTGPIALWASLTVGGGETSLKSANGGIATELGLHGAYDNWVAAVHVSGIGLLGNGSESVAVTMGRRMMHPHATVLWAVGPAIIHEVHAGLFEPTTTGPTMAAAAFTAGALASAHVIGLGVSAFGAWNPRISYVGIGLTLHAGWIQ